jgi:predicted TIM-barrel fold metal-dependent hydrolase
MRIDVHQHLWPEPFVSALSRRDEPPFVRLKGGLLELRLAGEQPSIVSVDDIDERAELVTRDGLDRALVALSTALGIETLPHDESENLLDAYRADALLFPDSFRSWGSIPLREPDPKQVDLLLDESFVGLSLPAAAIGSPAALDRLGFVLERLERRGAPVFVHPGPGTAPGPDDVPWWTAATDYVTSLHTAWCAWIAHGRRHHPRLRVVFAALGGLAPLHRERIAARGGPVHTERDTNLFYETSSYGPLAVSAMREAVDREQLVYGSDRPVLAPSPQWDPQLVESGPARLLA